MFNQKTIKSSEDYDNYLKQHITKYCVSTRLGRGLYAKEFFQTFDDAKNYLTELQTADQFTRSMIYGISNPPHTVLDVNVTMETA